MKTKVKKIKFSVAQESFVFAQSEVFAVPAAKCLGSGDAARFDAMFDSRSWVADLLARPVSSREVNS